MSVYILSAVWERAEVGGGELLVLLALADQARHDGTCRPSLARIAQMARMTERGAQKIIRRLTEKGLVAVSFEQGGRGHTNEYQVTIPEQQTPNAVRGIMAKPRTEAPETPNTGSPDPIEPVDDADETRASAIADEVIKAANADVSRPGWYDFNVHGALHRWRFLGLTDTEILRIIRGVMERRPDKRGPTTPSYFDRAMQEAAGLKSRPMLTPVDGGLRQGPAPLPRFEIAKVLGKREAEHG